MTTPRILKALMVYAQAYGQFRHVQDQVELEYSELESEWMEAWQGVLDAELEHETVDDEAEAEEDLKAFFASGDPSVLTDFPRWHEDDLLAARERYLPELETQRRRLETARQQLIEPYQRVAALLRDWLKEVRAGEAVTADAWPHILKGWCSARELTSREAAKALDISSAAVVRYWRGDRTPSVHHLNAMIGAMVDADPVPPDSDQRRALRSLERLSGPGLRETLHEYDERLAELRARVEDGLEGLSLDRLQTVVGLVEAPTALDSLRAWAEPGGTPLEPVLEPVRQWTGAGNAEERSQS